MRSIAGFWRKWRRWPRQRLIMIGAILLIALSLGASAWIVLTAPGRSETADGTTTKHTGGEAPSDKAASAQPTAGEDGRWESWIKEIDVEMVDEAGAPMRQSRIDPAAFAAPIELERVSESAVILLKIDPAHGNDVFVHENAVTFDGRASFSLEQKPASGTDLPVLSLNYASIRGTLVVHIGDFPEIRLLKKRDEATVAVGPADPSVPVQSLKSRVLRVPAGLRDLIISFSRPVSPQSEITLDSKKAEGTWTDDTHFRLTLPSARGSYLSVQAVGADGRRIDTDNALTTIEKVPDRQWYRYPTGTKVGFSRWDRYYDFLLFSPDGKQYVGMTDGWFAEGEGDNGYSLTLERRGKQPTLLKEYDQIFGFPLQWLDNTRLLFWGEDGAYVYDTATNARTAIMPLEDGRKIRSATYDPVHDLFTAIVDYPNGTGDAHEKWLVQHVALAASRNYGYEKLADDKADGRHTDFAVTQGVFHSSEIGSGSFEQYTVTYEGLKGNSWSRPGRGLLVHDDKLAVATGEAGRPLVLLSPNRAETPIAPLRGYNLHPFGDRLIGAYWTFKDQPGEAMDFADYLYAESTMKAYRIYDYGTDTWKPLFAGKTPWIRYQPFDSLYRTDIGQ